MEALHAGILAWGVIAAEIREASEAALSSGGRGTPIMGPDDL